ncbi:CD209 antigen-like protein A [Misgurnus anguillicaudatus]|uniref:CD209 antigen-like protein A n=1 Tax=Misgurnus anguillicaudatus TaxID=75329 RepID=UPI003CCF7C77
MDSTELYVNADAIRLALGKKIEDSNMTFTSPSPQLTVKDSMRMRSYRSVTVCLVLLCVLLLTAVIVLCVLIITINHQFYITSKNITDQRDQLLTKYTNITEERDQLEQLNATIEILKREGLTVFQSSLYFISSEKKTWSDSRTKCTQRGADLIIINNQEEQDFLKNMPGPNWIGLSDSDVEGTWKWVDGSTLNTRFWDKSTNEPNGGTAENCAFIYSSGWGDYPCTYTFNWICEKNMFK